MKQEDLVSLVVICFHFTIFVVLETTGSSLHRYLLQLWFAFILLSLSYWKQLIQWLYLLHISCDLLSFYYLCRTGNNTQNQCLTSPPVVICFHFTIFVVLETTRRPSETALPRCDLLSFYYLCRTGNNKAAVLTGWVLVVICFHFTIFVVLETTQHLMFNPILSCDLLSFYYLCRTGNNNSDKISPSSEVVICFHFTIFVVLETTLEPLVHLLTLLWFAFILLSLSYWKQRSATSFLTLMCCDLLSFYYLCRTGNNNSQVWTFSNRVVICFHFTIFVVLETTR